MPAPNLTLTVEPLESGSVVYLPMAPGRSNQAPKGYIALKLIIGNNQGAQVKIDTLTLSFPGSTVPSRSIPVGLTLAVNALETWWVPTNPDVFVPIPAPATVKLDLSCSGFSSPFSRSLPLAPHRSPTTAQSYLFPARISDLGVTEYWQGSSATHWSGGDQLFAHDLLVVGWDSSQQQWTGTLAGKSGDQNDHSRTWGKRIYAMADGTVVAFANQHPNNPKPGEKAPGVPVEGNHFYLRHGDEVVIYAHFQRGSLNSALTTVGATVRAGDFLGLAGNSGNSTGPHIHIHAIQGTAPWVGHLRPLPFHNLHVIERDALKPPDPSGPWVAPNDQGIPEVLSLIWPAPSRPTWYPPGFREIARHGVPESQYQTEFTRISSSGYRPAWIDAYDVAGQTFFNFVFRPNDGRGWVARHGLTSAGYQSEFNTWVGRGFRLTQVESYLSGGTIAYAALFDNAPGAPFTAYHGLSTEQHQARWSELINDGWRPVNITAVAPGGRRSYAALYEKRDVGGFYSRSFMTPAEYQTEFNSNVGAGRNLVYLNAYSYPGGPRIIAIFHQKAPGNFVARHGLSSGQYQSEFNTWIGKGLLTRAVTGYQEGGEARFAAFWR